MKNILVIGGMGAGKSSVTQALAAQGLPVVDLDALGHDALQHAAVKSSLKQAFGEDVLNDAGEIDRRALARAAFSSAATTEKLNSITQPYIIDMLRTTLEQLACEGYEMAVVESSSFTGQPELVNLAHCIVFVEAPEEQRIERLCAAGWQENDARARMARQLSDEEFARYAHVVFENTGAPEQLRDQVVTWLRSYQKAIHKEAAHQSAASSGAMHTNATHANIAQESAAQAGTAYAEATHKGARV